jgi:hypothetical protein
VGSISLFGQGDGALYSANYSSAWSHQIFGDFRTGQIAVRGQNSGTWQAWRTVLDSSNWSGYAAAASHSHDYATHRADGTNYIDYARYIYSTAHGAYKEARDLYVYYADLGRQVYDDNAYHGGAAWKEASQLGVKRAGGLTRNDSSDDYNVQTTWGADVGGYWSLRGYAPSGAYHAPCYVGRSGYADSAGSAPANGGTSDACSGVAARATRANGNLYVDDNYGNCIIGVYSHVRFQGVYSMGASYMLPADGTTTGNLYGLAWSYPRAGGAAGNLDSHGLLCLINGGFASAMSYSIVASANVTAYSDERLKKNWRDLPVDFVASLAKVKVGIYERIDQEITQVGVSAQSLREVLPEAITEAKDEIGTLSVNYGNAALASSVALAKEVVELRALVVALTRRIEEAGL